MYTPSLFQFIQYLLSHTSKRRGKDTSIAMKALLVRQSNLSSFSNGRENHVLWHKRDKLSVEARIYVPMREIPNSQMYNFESCFQTTTSRILQRGCSQSSPQRRFPLAVLPLLSNAFLPTTEAWDRSLLTWCTDRECSVPQPTLMLLCSHCNTDCEQFQWLLKLTWVHPCLCWLSCSEKLQSLNARVMNVQDAFGYLRKGIVTCHKPKITSCFSKFRLKCKFQKN